MHICTDKSHIIYIEKNVHNLCFTTQMFLMSPFPHSVTVCKLICWHRDWGVLLFWKDLMRAACILAHSHAPTSQSLGVTFNISLSAHLQAHTFSKCTRAVHWQRETISLCSLVALSLDQILYMLLALYHYNFHLHLISLSFSLYDF